MKLVVVSPRVLFRKALCSLLNGAGTFPEIIDIGRVLDLSDRIDKSQNAILIVHASDVHAGIASTHELRNLLPEARALMLADDADEDFAMQTLEAGAWGCLSTTDTPQILIKAVAKVAEGERWFAHRVTENLTPREWEVLALIAQGYSDKEVASSLFISTETARTHVKSIYKKLHVSTRRAAAVRYFKRVGPEGAPLSQDPEVLGLPDVS
jgi:DNA-binding NarL/FixJ family response regulator